MDNGLENTRNLINKMLDSQKPQKVTTGQLVAQLYSDSIAKSPKDIADLLESRRKDLYILVHWPYSQYFMDNDEKNDKNHPSNWEDGATFVPIQVYLDKIKELGE